jgi:hypothetical protein
VCGGRVVEGGLGERADGVAVGCGEVADVVESGEGFAARARVWCGFGGEGQGGGLGGITESGV